jgi:membrane protein DedA with SNARE-associated domain
VFARLAEGREYRAGGSVDVFLSDKNNMNPSHLIHQLSVYVFHLAPMAESLGAWMYLIIFAVAVLESTPVLGTFMPGTLFLLFFGFLVSVTTLHLPLCILVTTLGAMLGDCLGYLLGKYGEKFFSEHGHLLRLSHLEMGQAFFAKHGGLSIFVGRFVGPIRPIVPLVAGVVRMSPRRFVYLNILSALTWSGILMTIGYFVGYKWHIVERWLSRASIVLGLAAFIAVLLFVRRYRLNKMVSAAPELTS